MRITNGMMAANTIRKINSAARRLNEAQEQMASQKKIQLPSDDPVVAARAIKYRNYVGTIKQYQKNVDDVISWQKVTEGALSDLDDVIQQVRELTVEASSDTLSEEELAAIKTEISELRQQAIQIMNSSYAGRYIFGGFSTGEEPYQLVTTALGDMVTFKGQYLSLGGVVDASVADADIIDFCTANAANRYETQEQQAIRYNIGFGIRVTVNIEGQDVVGEGAGSNLFDTLNKLLLALDGDTTYKTAVIDETAGNVTVSTATLESIDELLTDLDADYDRLLMAQATLGARMNYVNSVKDRLSNEYTTYETLMSNNEDADVAEASTAVTTAEYVYEAALSVGAKVVTKTLVDYLA